MFSLLRLGKAASLRRDALPVSLFQFDQAGDRKNAGAE
jgi:hypothetical protein